MLISDYTDEHGYHWDSSHNIRYNSFTTNSSAYNLRGRIEGNIGTLNPEIDKIKSNFEDVLEKVSKIREESLKYQSMQKNISDGLMSQQLYMESPFPKAESEEYIEISDDELIQLFREISSSLGFEYEQPNDNKEKSSLVKVRGTR